MENIYEICFYGGLILAIIFLITSVVLFIVLKIPAVVGDLTGRTAKKTIKEMKDGTPVKESVAKKEQAKYYNQQTGKIKVREGVSTETRKENGDNTTDLLRPDTDVGDEATDVLSTGDEATDVLGTGDEATDVLGTGDEATDVLVTDDEPATDVLATDDEPATDVLATNDEEETTVLTGDGRNYRKPEKYRVEYNIVITHTDETL